jgi:hypothetical protein
LSRNTEDFEAAAKKLPKNRSVEEQALVDDGKANNVGNVRNLDYAATQAQKYPGK